MKVDSWKLGLIVEAEAKNKNRKQSQERVCVFVRVCAHKGEWNMYF